MFQRCRFSIRFTVVSCCAGNAPWRRPFYEFRQWTDHPTAGLDPTYGGTGHTRLGCKVSVWTRCTTNIYLMCPSFNFLLFFCFRIKNLMTETPTSYSLLVMFRDVIYAVRDPYGNRPLCIGRLVPISKLYSSGTFSMFIHLSDPLLW